ncbi:hypothetical protein Tco_1539109, partial [Tanacetum coccineum]
KQTSVGAEALKVATASFFAVKEAANMTVGWELNGFYKFILLEGLSAAIED